MRSPCRDATGNYLDGEPHLQGDAARADPREELLGLHGLRQPDPFAAADRPEARRGLDSNVSGHPEERGRRSRPSGSARRRRPAKRSQLGADHARRRATTSPLRLYGPLEPWFNKTRRPGDVELQP
ncbi:MAG: hypothetical protein MZW92_70830 [Comamonadaceae bacterium]|nr:hypothetical protein [Comamonadaceae bacterium]